MEQSSLYDLIENLEYGTKLHIGVIFFGIQRSKKLFLPGSATIHTGTYCWKMKEYARDAEKCVRCRNMAIQKAVSTESPFFGICVQGVTEYTHPVIVDGRMVGIIFIGNVFSPEGDERMEKALARRGLSAERIRLMDTMEQGIDRCRIESMGTLIESYIRLLLASERAEELPPVQDSVTADILTFIEENLNSDLGIRTIAEFFHYNEKYIGRILKKALGCSVRNYICRRRIERAILFLEESDDSVTGIAARVGFENISYFNRCFRGITGKTPTEYRRTIKSGMTMPGAGGLTR